jgi:flagellar protein FlaF
MPFSERAYGSPALRGARDTEYDIFSRVTRMLRQAPAECKTVATIAAVSKNNELWTLLASDLGHPDNALPDEVKAGLLSLAAFSIRHGAAVLAGMATTEPLIDINLCVMRGLRGEGAQ